MTPKWAACKGTQGNVLEAAKGGWNTGAYDSEGYEASEGLAKGTVTVRGTSLGAFTANLTEFAFQGKVTSGDFGAEMFFSSEMIDDSNATATYDYPNGTSGMSTPPLTMDWWLPALTLSGSPALYVLDGSLALDLTVMNSGGTTRYSGSGMDIDPVTGDTVHWTISGTLSPSTSPVDTASLALRETIAPEPGTLGLAFTGVAGIAGCLRRRHTLATRGTV